MIWFQIYSKNKWEIRRYPSLDMAYLDQFSQKNWQCEIQPINIRKLTVKELDLFLVECIKGIESGLKIHAVLQHFQHGTHAKKTRVIAMALESQLRQGIDFNTAFKELVDKALHSYCDLFVQQSTSEQLLHNLTVMQQQIHHLRTWTSLLCKALIYPFFVMQVALLMWLTQSFYQQADTIIEHIIFYGLISFVQIQIYWFLGSHYAIRFIENRFRSFRLNKLFSLMSASISVGNSLQKTLTQLPKNFSNAIMQQDLLLVYYKLRLGKNYIESFPDYWFPKESQLALNASCHSGDINRAIKSAAYLHQESWHKQLKRMEKSIPIFALIIAGSFVSHTLTSIYRPLLELH